MNPFKAFGDMNKLRQQAQQMQKKLDAEEITVEEGPIKVVISGSQVLKSVTVHGVSSPELITVLNKAIKKSQEVAAKELQSMTGGLGALMGGAAG